MQRIQGFARLDDGTGAIAPSATVTVYETGGTTLATIYSDNLASPTPKANPFTAAASGYWFFYAAGGKRYDVQVSGGGIATPYLAVVDAPAGLGDGAVPTITKAALDALPVADAAQYGRLLLLTDDRKGLFAYGPGGWKSVLDYGVRNVASVGALGGGVVGQLAFVHADEESTDENQGLYYFTGGDWLRIAGLPLPSTLGLACRGKLVQPTSGVKGLWAGVETAWFGVNGEFANASEFGALRDGSSDDLAAIQAAVDAAAASADNGAGGVVVLPPGTYAVSGPIVLKNGVILRGMGGTVITFAPGFSGDSLFQADGRDDGDAANVIQFVIEDLTVDLRGLPEGTSVPASFACVDLTGTEECTIQRCVLYGGPESGGNYQGVAIRLASDNYDGTTDKICYHNHIIQVHAEQWARFAELYKNSTASRVDNNLLLGCNASALNDGIDLTDALGTTRLTLINVTLDGGGLGGTAIVAPAVVPKGLLFLQVDQDNFGAAGLADNDSTYQSFTRRDSATGTTAAAPLASGGTSAQDFVGSIYLKLAAGTVLAAGANTYIYTLQNAPAGATFRLDPVAGVPSKAVTLQGGLSGNTLTVTVVAAAATTLAADFVFRAEQLAP
jgi:hypothetical protein